MQIFTNIFKKIENVSIELTNNRIYINYPFQCTLSLVNSNASNNIININNHSFRSNINYQKETILTLTKPDNIPFEVHISESIQNLTVKNGTRFFGKKIDIGSHVDEDKSYGNVVFQNGNSTIKAIGKVTITDNFKCKKGARLFINPSTL